MGNVTSPLGGGFWEEGVIVKKLLFLSTLNSGVANISQVEEFQQWKRHTTVQQVVNLLLQRDYYQTVKTQLKTRHIACAFIALSELLDQGNPESAISKKRQDAVLTTAEIAQIFYEVLDKYLDSTKNINPNLGPMLAHTQKQRVGAFFFSIGWDKLQVEEKQLLKERILIKEPSLVEHYQQIFQFIDPETDHKLYPFINEITKKGKVKKKAWIALASFGKAEDKARILLMLQQAKNGVLCLGEPKKFQVRCYTALEVVAKYPSHSYFDSLIDLFTETVSYQERFVNENSGNVYTWSTIALERAFKLLYKAILTYKTIEARQVIIDYISRQYDLSIVAWNKFRYHMLGWLGDALAEVQDERCFYLRIMQEVARSGQLCLPLLQRIMGHDKELALSWMGDLAYPVVVEMEDEDCLHFMVAHGNTPQSERLQWVLEVLVENEAINLIPVLCHYINHLHHSTCAVVCAFAFQFKDEPKISEALVAQLQRQHPDRVINQIVKTLLSFNTPALDEEVQNIIRTRMQTEKGFDRHGECVRLLGSKSNRK